MKTIKIPIKENKVESIPLDAMSLSSTKIAVDNNLAGLETHLRDVGFRHPTEVPEFSEFPKKEISSKNGKKYSNRIWKDKAIHRWLNENNYKIFVTNNVKDFEDFLDRTYGIISVDSIVMKDHAKLAKKIKLLFSKASHPYVRLFDPLVINKITKTSKMIYPKIKNKRS